MSTLSRIIFDPDITPPTVPQPLTAAALSSSLIRVSWGFSTDAGGSGLSGYRVLRAVQAAGPFAQVGSDLSTSSLSYDDQNLSSLTTYHYRVVAFDGAGNVSTFQTASATTQASAPTWSANAPPYLPIVPGAACHGADQVGGSGRHLGAANNAAIMFVDELGTGTTGSFDSVTRIGYGPARYCHNAPFPRHVIYLVNGQFDAMSGGSRNMLIDQPYATLHGHTAPGHLYFRGTQWQTNGSNLCLMHLHIMQDIYTDPAQADGSGDCASFLATPNPDRVLFANCGMQYATDETVGWFNPFTNGGLWQCLITEPIQNGNHPEFPHNYGMITRDDVTPVSIARTIFAHCQARNPLTSSERMTMHNSIVFNFGAVGVQIINTPPTTSDTNVEGNLFITGPDTETNDAIRLYDTLLAGSRVYVAGNRAIGIADSSQTDMVQNDEGLTLQSSRLTIAFPSGAVVTPITNEAQFADLVMRHCGPKPLTRISSLQRTIDNINARISGVGSQGGFVSTPTTAGGYPTVTNLGPIDPSNPGSFWGGLPCPMTLATRNVTQPDGYTLIEKWSHAVEALYMPAA